MAARSSRAGSTRQARERFRALDLAGQRDVLDLFTKSAGDVLDRWFESAPIKAAFGFDAVVGNFASPYTPGSAYVLLHHVFGEVNGKRGQWGHAIGGMGAITQAMAKECAARGVTLRTDAPVARVVVKAGRAAGVELESGEVVEARRVVANVNPKLLFERLVAPEHLDAGFSRAHRRLPLRLGHVPHERRAVRAARLHGAARQDGASRITAAASSSRRRSPTWSAPISMRRRDGWSRAPIVEMLIPSVVDDTLAPPGMHVASLFCQHVHPDLAAVLPGRTWDDARDEVADLMIDTVDRVRAELPRERARPRARSSPLDLEREFGLDRRRHLPRRAVARPALLGAPGARPRRLPHAGARRSTSAARATHPGGGVTGVPGTTRRAKSCATRAAVATERSAAARRAIWARASRRSASRRSSRGARSSTRSPCWARRCAPSSASATRCSSARSPPDSSSRVRASPAGRAADRCRACARGARVRARCVGALALAALALAQGRCTLCRRAGCVAGAAMALCALRSGVRHAACTSAARAIAARSPR